MKLARVNIHYTEQLLNFLRCNFYYNFYGYDLFNFIYIVTILHGLDEI